MHNSANTAVAGITALVILIGIVARIASALDRADRARTRAARPRTRPPEVRTPVRYRPAPPGGVGYRPAPRPPINSSEALDTFRDPKPPGAIMGPPTRTHQAAKKPPKNPDELYQMVVTSLADTELAYQTGRISRVDRNVMAAKLKARLWKLEGASHETVTSGPMDAPSAALLKAAAELVITTHFGSTAMVQRKLGISAERAAAVMDGLEACGIVGPAKGAVARDVLVPLTGLSAALNAIRQQSS